MTLHELLTSESAKEFQIEMAPARDDVIYLYKPQFIAIPIDGLKITDIGGLIFLELFGRYSITLYKQTGTTHTSIF